MFRFLIVIGTLVAIVVYWDTISLIILKTVSQIDSLIIEINDIFEKAKEAFGQFKNLLSKVPDTNSNPTK